MSGPARLTADVLLGAALWAPAGSAAAQQVPTPAPEDVPQPAHGQVELAGSSHPDITRFLNVRWAWSPSVSPDGAELSYLTDTTGDPQLWAVPAPPAAPRQLTFLGTSVTFQSWSPAGAWIAYGTDRQGDEREGFYLVSPDGLIERELLPPSDAFRVWGGWSPDGTRIAYASTERNGVDFDVYLMDVAADGTAGPARRVHEGRGGIYVARWRPDGGALLLTESVGEADANVHLLDLETGTRTTLLAPEDPASYAGFAWTPDGRGFYVATNQGRDRAGLAFYDVEQGDLRWVETPDAEVEDVELSADGRWLAWTVNAGGWSELRLRDVQAGADRPAAGLPRGVYGLGRWASQTAVLPVVVSAPSVPGDVWLVDAEAGVSARATRSATGGLDPMRFVAPEPVSFPSWDGETIHGLLYLPPRALDDRRPPVVLSVHGGPTAQARPEFDPGLQYLLTRGVAVLDLNYRGSTGYGRRFTRLDDRRLRPDAVRDLGGALDWLARSGRVDAARAAILGGSYGGYLTFAGLTHFPARFRAGVGFVGVSNWITALEGASPQLKASDRVEYGDIDDPEDRAFFTELSPITHVDSIRAPLMVLHGANDPRDPVGEADQLVAAVRARGGEVEYLRFPDEGHGIRKLANRIIAWRRIATFLERTLEVETGRTDPSPPPEPARLRKELE